MLDQFYRKRFRDFIDFVSLQNEGKPLSEKPFRFRLWMASSEKKARTLNEILRHPCGTSCCIGGWGALFQLRENGEWEVYMNEFGSLHRGKIGDIIHSERLTESTEDLAATYFGLTVKEVAYLFFGGWHPLRYDRYSKKTMQSGASEDEVIQKLERIVATGTVIEPEWDARTFPPARFI